MANALSFDLLARDRGASSTVNKLGTAFEKTERSAGLLNKSFGAVTAGTRGLHTSFGLLGKGALFAAGAAGLGGLVEAFKGVYEEAREAQKTGAQTNAVIKSTGGVARVSASHVGDLATAISNKVGVDDEAIQSGANLILTFTKVRNEAGKGNDVFDQATRTVTDMAAAMNNGAVTTDGLKSASIQVGKALNDPLKGITALTKVGVTFDEGQKKQIATLVKHHDTLGAQKIILAELNKEFGGSAAAGTTAGQKLGVVFGNIKETIGTKLLPTIDAAADWFARRLPGALDVTSAFITKRIMPVFRAVSGFITDTVIPGFQGLGAAFSGEGITSDGFVGVMETIGNAARNALTYLQQTFVPQVVDTFKSIKGKVEANLPSIDLSGIAATFKQQAAEWGVNIIAGVKTGLDTGDWSGLGETVGRGIVSAISGAARFAKEVGTKVGELLQKVDWVGVGIAVGKQVPSLLVGLAAGILNFDLMGLLKGLAAHWQDVLFAIIAVAFTPARIIGKVAEVLARIPLVGRLLAWGLEHFAAFSKGLVRMVGDALAFMGRAFIDGFRRVFPGVGVNFLAHLRNLPTYIGVVALEVVAKAKLLMKGLADTIARGIAGVIARIGELIARMLRPFVGAGGWLIRRGVEFVSGLIRGVTGMIGSAVSTAGRVISSVTRPFAAAGRWLLGAGGDLVRGLLSGARSALSAVGQWAKDIGSRIVGAVKSFFKIGSPSKVFAELGGHLMSGLAQGMIAHNPVALVDKVFGGMTGALRTLFTKNLLGDVTNLGSKALSALGGLVGNVVGNVTGPVVSGSNVAIGQMLAARYGWTGAQWEALRTLWQNESGWNNNAQNPTSTAYGIAQFLNSTWGAVGATKTSDPVGQISAGLRYIQGSYGSPINALSKWMSRSPHWYDQGGWLPPGLTMTMNGTGRHERIRTGQQEDALATGLARIEQALMALAGQPVVVNMDSRPVARAVRNQNSRNSSGW